MPRRSAAVCTVSNHDMAQNKGSTSLWWLPTCRCAPRRLTHCGDKDGQPSWSPQGDRIAFVPRREMPEGRRILFAAWVWPLLRGSAAQYRQHKAFAARKTSAYLTSEAQYRHFDHHLPMGRVVHLLLLDLRSGRIRDLFEGTAHELGRQSPDPHAFDISPDGRRICFAHDPAARQVAGNPTRFTELDLASGRFHRVDRQPGLAP